VTLKYEKYSIENENPCYIHHNIFDRDGHHKTMIVTSHLWDGKENNDLTNKYFWNTL